MSTSDDRDLGMHRDIARRDFVNGVGVAVTWLPHRAGMAIGPRRLALRRTHRSTIPPARTGMRGSHPGSFEVAHQLRGLGSPGPTPSTRGESYDLVVVGAGLSGLSAAYFFLTSAGPGARECSFSTTTTTSGATPSGTSSPTGAARSS